MIDYLQNKVSYDLEGNTKTPNGNTVAKITSPKILKELIGIIEERNKELLTSEDPYSSQKLQPVIESLQIQNVERAESKSDEGHDHYHDIPI